MYKLFKPDIYQESIFTINYIKYKKQGIKCIAFDLDNTLTEPHSKILSKETIKLIKKLKKDFQVIIISNSLNKRVKHLNKEINIPIYSFSLKPLQRNYKRIIKNYNYKPEEILTVGDQLITDVLGGHRAKVKACLVKPICKEDFITTKINRLIERRIFNKLYKKYNIKEGEYYE